MEETGNRGAAASAIGDDVFSILSGFTKTYPVKAHVIFEVKVLDNFIIANY